MFQSTRPCGARPACACLSMRRQSVSIHAPVRGATRPHGKAIHHLGKFQSTRPCGARQVGLTQERVNLIGFNPRARAGRDAGDRDVLIGGMLFQSTRPCGARHTAIELSITTETVSIHAPVRGATRSQGRGRADGRGFNPRARAGRDTITVHPMSADKMFQSTRPCGARQAGGEELQRSTDQVSIHAPARGATSGGFTSNAMMVQVSIHAPARGATFLRPLCETFWNCFNPRARAGRDLTKCVQSYTPVRFQSTRPRGARQRCRCHYRQKTASFNPRARAGRDKDTLCVIYGVSRVSIHAPARGATRDGGGRGFGRQVSIHAPARGATATPLPRCFP